MALVAHVVSANAEAACLIRGSDGALTCTRAARSVVLEMVEFIRSENIKALVAHLVEKFGSQLEDIDYVDTFRALRLKYDQVHYVQGKANMARLDPACSAWHPTGGSMNPCS